MFPFKRKTASDTSTSPELTEEERQRRKKFVIYPLMFLLFAGSMWLIFAPSEKEEEKQAKGFNTEVPDPMATELIGDKKKAYEKEMMEQKEQERSQAMQSLSSMFGEMTGGQPVQSSEELALKTDLSERDNGFGSRTTAPQDSTLRLPLTKTSTARLAVSMKHRGKTLKRKNCVPDWQSWKPA